MTGRKVFWFRILAAASATGALVHFFIRRRRTIIRVLTAGSLPPIPALAVIIGLAILAALLVRRRPACLAAIAGRRSLLFQAATLLCGLAVFATLLALRRPGEVRHPYVWDEDGTRNIPDYLQSGWLSLLVPVNGYFIFIPKLINILSLKLSFLYYPEISMSLGFIFNLFVLASIWKAPTVLPGKYFCALAALLIPNGSEVYIVPLYTFWWAGLLVALALLWNPERRSRAEAPVRIGFLIAGGLSSPIIILSAPIFVLRALIRRTGKEWAVACIAVALAAIQLAAVQLTVGGGKLLQTFEQSVSGPAGFQAIVLKYFAWGFLYPCQVPPWGIALMAIALGCAVCWLCHRPGLYFFFVALMYAAAVASSLGRVPVWAVDPVRSGPRYFFYPYVFLWWFVVGVAALHLRNYWRGGEEVLVQPKDAEQIRAAPAFETAPAPLPGGRSRIPGYSNFIGVIICYSLLGAGVAFSSRHYMRNSQSNRLHWRASILPSINFMEPAEIPIQFNGTEKTLWRLEMQPGQCKKLIDGSLLDRLILARN